MSDNLQMQTAWQGAHHLSLVTPDLDATVRFYHGLLGMPLWAALGPMPYHGRHCLFKAGHFLIHFFEQPDAEIAVPPPDWMKKPLTLVAGVYQHLALEMESEEALLGLRERLISEDVAVSALMNQGPIRQFLFLDNNGIFLEANWTPFDLIAQPIDYSNSQLFNDPDPVPAVREILEESGLG